MEQNFNRRENDNREYNREQQAQQMPETQQAPIYKNKWVIGGSVLAIAAAVGTTFFIWKKNKKAKKAEVVPEGANFEGVK